MPKRGQHHLPVGLRVKRALKHPAKDGSIRFKFYRGEGYLREDGEFQLTGDSLKSIAEYNKNSPQLGQSVVDGLQEHLVALDELDISAEDVKARVSEFLDNIDSTKPL